MLEGIDDINWESFINPYSNIPATDIPKLLPKLLDADKRIRQRTLNAISDIFIVHDQISYFSDVTPLALPFLLEIVFSDGFEDIAEFLEAFTGGFMLLENFGLEMRGVSDELMDVYHAIIRILEQYASNFVELLQHSDPEVRFEVAYLLSYLLNAAHHAIPTLVNAATNMGQNPNLTIRWQVALHNISTYETINGEPHKQQLLNLWYIVFRKTLEDVGDSAYIRRQLTYYVRDIIEILPEAVPKDMVLFLRDELKKQAAIVTLPIAHEVFDDFLLLLKLVNLKLLDVFEFMPYLQTLIPSVSPRRLKIVSRATKLKLDVDKLTELKQAIAETKIQDTQFQAFLSFLDNEDTASVTLSEKELWHQYFLYLREERETASRQKRNQQLQEQYKAHHSAKNILEEVTKFIQKLFK